MKNNRILIADESSETRQKMISILEGKGLGPFIEASCPNDVWRAVGIGDLDDGKLIILNEYCIDLVILDLSFGAMGGEMCRRVKEFDVDLPVFCLSSHCSEETELIAIENGADAFQCKPLNEKIFTLKTKKLIEKWEIHSRLRANYESLKTVYKTLPPLHRVTKENIGDYKVLGSIGKGASSVVYKCRKKDSIDFFALKILSEDVAHNADVIVNFRDEIDNLLGLDHPNIIKIFDHGIQGGFPYYVMEYVEGCNLGEVAANGPDLSFREVLNITKSLISGLDYIHQSHVIHRDLKLENILITENWSVKLTDFGLSVQEEKKKTTIQGVMGTPLYVAPELIAGREETYKVDTYAFGVALYKLLTSKFPFDSNNVAEIMHSHCTVIPTPVKELNPKIPNVWSDLVDACLQKNPLMRPNSLLEFTENGKLLENAPF
jgi:CheY-like chemotaxis protein